MADDEDNEKVNVDKDSGDEKSLEVNSQKGVVFDQVIEEEMKKSFLDYAMSVIVARALPDVRDGLKPVHRRLLFAMNELGLQHNKKFRKSATIVGEVLGKYHPHGDVAVYDSMVRMAQPWALRYPLVHGQGNFGSIDGDSPAAYRYCVTGNTLIMTNKGLLPIKKLSKKEEEKINIKIVSYNRNINHASKFFNCGKHKIIKIQTEHGYELSGSENHPVLCWVKNEFGAPSLEWKRLSEITNKDYVLINRRISLFSDENCDLTKYYPKKSKRQKTITLPKEMSVELAFLLGSLVSEGSFHQGKVIFNNQDMAFYSKVKKIALSLFKGITVYERNIAGNCKEFEIYHQQATKFLENIGLNNVKSDKKEIPFTVLCSKKEVVKSFLTSLFEGDGSVQYIVDKRHGGQNIVLSYDSKSKLLISQLKTVLLMFGVSSIMPQNDKRNGCQKLIVSGVDSIKNFQSNIDFFSKRKREILAKINNINSSRMSKNDFIPYLSEYLKSNYKKDFLSKYDVDRYNTLKRQYTKLVKILKKTDKTLVDWILINKYLFSRIKTVEHLKTQEEVYSIKVDGKCHSFVGNGFINHNTEAKLSKISDDILLDIKKETVNWTDNFDATLKEPEVLPTKVPNLLINGSTGIAVGMATNIPPHNITEVSNAIIALIDNPEMNIKDLIEHIPGPDFPTGGIIYGKGGICNAYATGYGKLRVDGKTHFEKNGKKDVIVIDEIPYTVNKAQMIEEIADLVKNDKIEGISDIRDESDRDGMRAVIELKKDTSPEVVLNQILKHSRLSITFGFINLVLVNGRPKVLDLKDTINCFINHRIDVITRRTKFDLNKCEERSHILEGLMIALQHIDAVVALIKKSKTVETAKTSLMSEFKLSDKQSLAILDMKLQKITNIETQTLKTEFEELKKEIAKLKEILASKQTVLNMIKQEMAELKQKYGDARKTQIVEVEEQIDMEDLIEPQDVVVTVSHAGYVKRMPVETYREQNRGGKGVSATSMREEDFVEHIFASNTHDYLLVFTTKGKIHWLKVYQIPEGTRQAKGKPIINLIRLEEGEKVATTFTVKDFGQGYLFFSTKKGTVKKTSLDEYSRPRAGGIIALGLDDGDELINVVRTTGENKIIMGTKKGNAVLFSENDVRPMGRSATGVIGIRLSGDDEVVGCEIAHEGHTILTVTENGFGKRTALDEYRHIKRGGSGVINIKCSERNGDVVGIKCVKDNESIMIISRDGVVIRTSVDNISVIGRNTQGVTIMKLNDTDKVVALAVIPEEKID